MRNVIYKDPAEFFRAVDAIHAGAYDYTNSVYVSTGHTITYQCPTHGSVTQRAGHHLDGSGCPRCNLGMGPKALPALAAKERARTMRAARRHEAEQHAHLAALARREPEHAEVTAYIIGNLRQADGGVFAGNTRVDVERADGYRIVNLLGRKYLAHRLVWLLTTGAWPSTIDHVDGDRGNNTPANLRSVDAKLNAQNRYAPAQAKGGGLPIGVYARGRRFRACIRRDDGVQISLGTFDTPELAHAAYLGAKAIYQTGATHV